MGDITDIFRLDSTSWSVSYDKGADLVILDKCTSDGSSLSGSTQHEICYAPSLAFSDIDLSGEALKRMQIAFVAGYASTNHMWDYNWDDPHGDGKATYGIGMFEAELVIEDGKISDIENIVFDPNANMLDKAFYNRSEEFGSISEYMRERFGK